MTGSNSKQIDLGIRIELELEFRPRVILPAMRKPHPRVDFVDDDVAIDSDLAR